MSYNDLMGVQPEMRRETAAILAAEDARNDAVELRATALETRAALIEKALQGDMVLVVTPATDGSSAAAITAAILADGKFVRTVHVELQTAAGEVHTWYDGTFAAAGTEVTAGDGTAPTAAATVALVNGAGDIDQEYIGAWAAADTATVTITGGTKLGYTIANKTSVDTVVA